MTPPPVAAVPAAPASAEASLLTRFLSGRDAACPICGYNLRDVPSGTCPECGRRLALGIEHPEPVVRRRAVFVLLFAWLLLAGGMNAWRAVDTVRTTMRAPTQQFVLRSFLSAPIAANELFGTIAVDVDRTAAEGTAAADGRGDARVVPETPRVMTVEIDTVVGSASATPSNGSPDGSRDGSLDRPSAWTTDGASGHGATGGTDADAAAPRSSPGRPRTALGTDERIRGLLAGALPAPIAAGPGRVTAGQWAAVAWWTTLTGIALAALVLLAVHRRRPAPPRVVAALTVAAWTTGLGYAAWHVVRFAADVA